MREGRSRATPVCYRKVSIEEWVRNILAGTEREQSENVPAALFDKREAILGWRNGINRR